MTWTFDALDGTDTLVTVNNRLSVELRARYDRRQLAAGHKVWPSADILPWDAWMQRQYRQVLDSGHTDLDLLSASQEHLLWEEIIGQQTGGTLLRPAAAADSARSAYALYLAWRLDEHPLSLLGGDETRSLLAWVKTFEARLARHRLLSPAALPAMLTEAYRKDLMPVPGRLIYSGFDDLSPVQADLLETLRDLGCELIEYPGEERPGTRQRMQAADSETEIRMAAEWARALLNRQPDMRIAVISVRIAQLRNDLERLFGEILAPVDYLGGTAAASFFNISLGRPLAQCPLVAHALAALRLLTGAQPLHDIGQLLRSPFLGGHAEEWERRALFDRALREDGRPKLDLRSLCYRLGGFDTDDIRYCADLATRLQLLQELRDQLPSKDTAAGWAVRLRAALGQLGWPGGQSLDSHEYQQQERMQRVFSELAELGKVRPHMTLAEAVARLGTLVSDTLFQPRSPPAPIQILGPLEATGGVYDAVWLLGMDDASWPPPPQPHPLLPARLQRDLGMPHASAARELRFAASLTSRLTHSAPRVVASNTLSVDGREQRPSPLIRDWPLVESVSPDEAPAGDLRLACAESGATEALPPAVAGPASPAQVGGAALIAAQAKCPFAAVARFRMGARPLEEPVFTLDAALAGTLVHELLQRVWHALGDSSALAAHDRTSLAALIEPLATATLDDLGRRRPDIFTSRFKDLEAVRLTRLMTDWLDAERGRGQAFRVEALELAQTVDLAGLQIKTRVDRVDRLDDGSLAVIDYKTGRSVRNDGWFDERLTEPQLPLYCLQNPADTSAVLLARVRRDGPGCGFAGISRHEGFAPGVDTAQTQQGQDGWQPLLTQWQQALDMLAAEIQRGRADPTPSVQACRYCALGALCRVQEMVAEAVDD